MLRVLYAVDLGILVGGVAAEFALAALVVDFKARAVGGEHNGLRRELFHEIAEKLAGHDRFAAFGDFGDYHMFD